MDDTFLFEEIVKPNNYAKRKNFIKDYSFKKKNSGLKPLKRDKYKQNHLTTEQDDYDE